MAYVQLYGPKRNPKKAMDTYSALINEKKMTSNPYLRIWIDPKFELDRPGKYVQHQKKYMDMWLRILQLNEPKDTMEKLSVALHKLGKKNVALYFFYPLAFEQFFHVSLHTYPFF
jgi:hypothetical protein